MNTFKVHSDLEKNAAQVDERVRWFYQRFQKLYRNEAHFVLACHAAFPIALTADLLYQIWINFQPMIKQSIPYEAVSDILLSPLCEEVRPELFEMDKSVRDYLLANLSAHPDYGPQRLRQLAHFLIAYSKATFTKNYEATLAKSQRVTAIAYLDPELAAQEIVGTLNQLSDAQAREELGRVSDLVETLDVPLAQLPELINYSRALGAELRGNSIRAQRLMAGLQVVEEEVEEGSQEVIEVAGSTLYVNENLRELVRTKIKQDRKKAQWSTTERGYWEEAKIMLVGPDGGGKTTLARQILGNPFSPRDASESTIEINHFQIPVPLRGDMVHINTHIWDLGNQETQYGTDQLFYTANTLYLLVFSNRHTPREILSWVAQVSSWSNYSPVLILLNEFEEQEAVVVDQQLIQQQYANVVDCIRVNPAGGQGVQELNEALRTQLSRLALLRKEIPTTWLEFRQGLNSEQSENQLLSFEEFISLCTRYGIESDGEIRQLLQDLRQLGLIMHYANDPVLRPVVFLQHSWLTKAIHRILNLSSVQSSGRFSVGQLGRPLGWNYGESQFDLLLTAMQRIGLCFSREEENYIVPMLLPRAAGPLIREEEAVRYEFNYTLRFPNVFPRLLEKLKAYIQDDNLRRNRVSFQLDNGDTNAIVVRDPYRNSLNIYAQGNRPLTILYRIRRALEQIHETYPGIVVKERIPCPCSECKTQENGHRFDKEYILQAEKRGVQYLACVKSGEDVALEDLLRLIKHIPLEVTIQEAEALITQGDLMAAVKLLIDAYTIKTYSSINTQLLLQYARLNSLEKRRADGVITETAYLASYSRIRNGVLDLIAELKEAMATGQSSTPDAPIEEEEQIEVKALIIAPHRREAEMLTTYLEETNLYRYPDTDVHSIFGYIRRTQKKVPIAILAGFGDDDNDTTGRTLEEARRYKAEMVLLIGQGFQSSGASKEGVQVDSIVVGTLINSITFNDDNGKGATTVTSVDVELIRHARTINKDNTWLARMLEDENIDQSILYRNSNVHFGQVFAGLKHQRENPSVREQLQSVLNESLIEIDFTAYDIIVKLSEDVPQNKRFVVHGVFPPLPMMFELQDSIESNAVEKAAAFAIELVATHSGYSSKAEAAYQCKDWETIEALFQRKAQLQSSSEAVLDHLLLFSTRKQQTWLIATETRLFLLLDGIDQAKSNQYIRWVMSHEEALGQIKVNPSAGYNSPNSGLLNIGSRKNWLYSRRLFPEPQQLEEAIREMLARAQQASLPDEPFPDLPEQNIQQQNIQQQQSSTFELNIQFGVLSSAYGRINKLMMVCRQGDWIGSMLTLNKWLKKLPSHIQLVLWADSVEELADQLREWEVSYRVRSTNDQSPMPLDHKERCYIIPSPITKRSDDENHHWIRDAFFVRKNGLYDGINLLPTSAPLQSDENIDLAQMLAGTGYVHLDTQDVVQPWLKITPHNILVEQDFALIGKDGFEAIVDQLKKTNLFFRSAEEEFEERAKAQLREFLSVERLIIVGTDVPVNDSYQPFPHLDQFISLLGDHTVCIAELEPLTTNSALMEYTQERNRMLAEIASWLQEEESLMVIRNPNPAMEYRENLSSPRIVCPSYNNCLTEIISPEEKNVYLPNFTDQREILPFNVRNQTLWQESGFNVIAIDQIVPQHKFDLYAPRNITLCLDREIYDI
ncbi:MAG: COR domain-containing protein [Bacteroidota bacterium]